MESSSFLPQTPTPPTSSTQSVDQQLSQVKTSLTKLLDEDLRQLEDRKKKLQVEVDQLERRQERLQAEMRKSFPGVSQELAVRVQGFKDYLVTSLQDLAMTAEQLELDTAKIQPPAPPNPPEVPEVKASRGRGGATTQPQFGVQSFQDEVRQIKRLLEQYRNSPNYYGPSWQLRRTFEPIHSERVSKWFFSLGGRGAIRSVGTRLQNILVASAIISVLTELYGDRVFTLILADSPERLGDWRRGLQDCLGVTREDFGPDQGIALFESPEPLVQKADRLQKDDCLPFIILDDSEEMVSLSVLQFPMWLGFAPEPQLRRERSSGGLDWFE
jgi:Protein of unknown function (DUF3086)